MNIANWVGLYLFSIVLLSGLGILSVAGMPDRMLSEISGDHNSEKSVINNDRVMNVIKSDSSFKTTQKNFSLLRDSIAYKSDSSDFTPSYFFTSFQKDSLIKSWADYISWHYGLGDSTYSDDSFFVMDSAVGDVISQSAGNTGGVQDNSLNIKSEGSSDSISSENAVQKLDPELTHLEITTPDKYFRFPYYFVVQVAASKTRLDSVDLRKKYNGPLEIRKIEEEDWFKYQIGVTGNYLEALQIWKSVSTDGAFIVAYNADGEKLRLWKAVLSQKRNLIRYRVQIAASRIPLSNQKILDIYGGDMKILEIEEEGWYKYQIDVGKKYQEARKNEQLINVEGAFMIPYLGNDKMLLYDVLRFYRF